MMRDTLKTALKCFLSVLIVDLMCFFIYGSFVTVALSLGETEINGYQVITYNEEGMPLESVYCTKEEKEEKVKTFEADGTEYTAQEIKVLTESTSNFVETLTGICSFLILFAMVYTSTWSRGDKDYSEETFAGVPVDKFRGLKIGLFATAPIALVYLYFLVDKFAAAEYYGLGALKTTNYYLFPIVNGIAGSASTANDVPALSAFLLLVTLIVIPLISVLGYYLGSHGISIKEKLLYVKKEKK